MNMNENENILIELSQLVPVLEGSSNKMPYRIPDLYFVSFPDAMLLLAKKQANSNEVQNELVEIAPLLNSISKKPIQALPDGYFSQINIPVNQANLPIVKKMPIRKIVSYAAAAMVAGMLVLGGFLFTNKAKNLKEFQQYSKININQGIDDLSDEEIQNYINSSADLAGASQNFVFDETEIESEEGSHYISDDELIQYLNEQNGKS
jgi:hypothetical protein